MILSSPGDVLFDFGVIKIYYYGVIMALSVIFGLLACKLVCRLLYVDEGWEKVWETTYNLALGTIIFGFLGARLYYVLASFDYFSMNLGEIFAIQKGGMSIHGAILGGVLFAVIYLKKKNLQVLKYLDILTFGLITGQIIGRWGNFFNSEAFGLPTFGWLKLYIPVENRPVEFMAFDYFHPTFLYEMLLNILILIVLTIVAGKKFPKGIVTFLYILLYSVVRIFVEQIRLDSVLNLNGIPLAQVVSGLGIIIGFTGIFIVLKNYIAERKKHDKMEK